MKNARLVVALSVLFLGWAGFSSAQDQALSYYNAGNTFYSQQNYDQATRYYQYATQLNPNLWQAYQGLGNCYYAKGDKATSLTDYQKALALNPNNPQLSQFVQTLQPQASSPGGTNPSSGSSTDNAAASSSLAGSGFNPNLPRQGKILFEIEDSDWVGGWDDLDNIYGGTIVSSSSDVVGFKLGLGAAYVFSPNFQLGVKLQYLVKEAESVSTSIDGIPETDLWNESAFGGAVVADGVFPLGDGVNFIGSLEGGFYTLVGSTVTGTTAYGTATENLSASSPGGMISAGIEFLMDSKKTWTLDLGLDYQFLSFSPVTATYNGQSETATNASGGNASLDFSGVGLFLAARLY